MDQRRSQLHPSVGGQAGKFYKCQMFELIEIPEESSFTPLPTPYVSLELFIFGAKYLPQIILYRWHFVRLIELKWCEYGDFMADLQESPVTDKTG